MKEKQRKKSGVSRLFEIAGEKKGLLMLAGVLSAVSALMYAGALLVGI